MRCWLCAAYRAALMEGVCKVARRDRAAGRSLHGGHVLLLDRLFRQSAGRYRRTLNLIGDVTDAPLRRTGKLGELLALAEAAERRPARIEQGPMRMGVGNEDWCRTQVEALRWALQVGGTPDGCQSRQGLVEQRATGAEVEPDETGRAEFRAIGKTGPFASKVARGRSRRDAANSRASIQARPVASTERRRVR